ncbi:UDP-glucose:glycoprotein glucosyltransferase [Galendromus occidentalis]|uniref:UDP-glucose:glycoprotein glucosyltransferase n=1 Tax=Galendromus occidentalis TaxID=34638 RepID=A0AAJ7PAJ1_9ACAR|nr:UDP-glucose:glycoprotein glucosyltransferase [Galendromus occidentalis]
MVRSVKSFRLDHCCILILVASFVDSKIQKPLTISLDARWNHTPLHLEAAEFFAEEGADTFWRYVTDFQKLDLKNFTTASEKVQYENIIELASRQLSEGRFALFKLSLALRAHSPAVEAFQRIAQDKELPDCEFVFELPGHVTCILEEIDSFIEERGSGLIDVYGIDHEFGASTDGVIVVLYADIAHPDFHRYHNALVKRLTQGKIRYILRHHVSKSLNRKVRLGGYGVELALKSMEYKSQDDASIKERETSTSDEDTDSVDGDSFEIENIMVSSVHEVSRITPGAD